MTGKFVKTSGRLGAQKKFEGIQNAEIHLSGPKTQDKAKKWLLDMLSGHEHSITNGHEGDSAVQHVPLCLCSLLAATSQFCILIDLKMLLTG